MREPAVASGFGDGTLIRFANSIWTATTPIRFAGTWFPHVMSIVRLGDDSLLIHSPCQPSSDLLHAIAQIGIVAHVVAPNWFHDLYLAHYRKLYPSATFWAPPFLKRQRASIIDCALDVAARPPWFDEMPHTVLSGLLALDECIFFHRSTRYVDRSRLLDECLRTRRPAFSHEAWLSRPTSRRKRKSLSSTSMVRIYKPIVAAACGARHLGMEARSAHRGARKTDRPKRRQPA